MIRKRITLQLKNGATIDTLASPKLFRALIFGIAELYGKDEAENIINENVTVTDLLYWSYTKNKQITYFYPKPIYVPVNEKNNSFVYTRLKALKKAKYVSEEVYQNYFSNILDFLHGKDNLKIEKNLIFSKKEEILIKLKKEEVPHNLIGRIKELSLNEETPAGSLTQQFFYLPEIWISNGGIYFDIVTENENTMNKLIASLRFLEDRGLGKKITIGKGSFEIKNIGRINSFYKSASKTKMLLSHWVPSKQEMENQKIIPLYFSLVQYQPVNSKIKTLTLSSVPLPKIYMISSGSIITSRGDSPIPEVIGSNHRVNDKNNPSVIPGKAITMPFDLKRKEEN